MSSIENPHAGSGYGGGMTPDPAAAAVRWIVTTQDAAWHEVPGPDLELLTEMPNVFVLVDDPKQLIEGFGASFNELGWTSLGVLETSQRDEILRELFAPGVGAGLSLCRMPVGANDFSRDWYSYDEAPGDFALAHFDISQRPRDARSVHPRGAGAAARPAAVGVAVEPAELDEAQRPLRRRPAEPVHVQRGERPASRSGRSRGHRHVHPRRAAPARVRRGTSAGSSTPTASSASRSGWSCRRTSSTRRRSSRAAPGRRDGFVQLLRHLGPEMAARDVEIFLAPSSAATTGCSGEVLGRRRGRRLRLGTRCAVGGQGRGRRASSPAPRTADLPDRAGVRRRPQRLAARTIRVVADEAVLPQRRQRIHVLEHLTARGRPAAAGAGRRTRWSSSTPTPRPSAYTHEYQVLKHVSALRAARARCVEALSYAGYDNQLAFLNPDGSIVIVIQNDMARRCRSTSCSAIG